MAKRKISFSPPDISELEISEVEDALRSGWITTGPRVKQLEKNLGRFCQNRNMVCLNSGTAAEELNLRVLGIREGDEIIVPAYTYTATVSAAIHVGAVIRMVDSQKGHWEMDYDAVGGTINERTKAIIPVDLGGVPCNYQKLFEIVEDAREQFCPQSPVQEALGRIAVVSDSAHALGARWKGQMVGSIADFTSFSFHAVKNMTTAEGGAAAWKSIDGMDDGQIYKQYQLMSLHGQSKDALEKTQLGSWEYDIVEPYYKCNMTDIMAAIGLKQLERYEGMLARRKAIIARYDEMCDRLHLYHLDHFNEEYQSSGHLYITRIPGVDDCTRRKIIVEMAGEGIACNVHYKPLPLMTAYQKRGIQPGDYPNAIDFYQNEITLPLNSRLSEEDVEYIAQNYERIVRHWI